MGGGYLVGGLICPGISVNKRELNLLISYANPDPRQGFACNFLIGMLVFKQSQEGNNRSVMPLDVLGRTRATLTMSTSLSFAERRG